MDYDFKDILESALFDPETIKSKLEGFAEDQIQTMIESNDKLQIILNDIRGIVYNLGVSLRYAASGRQILPAMGLTMNSDKDCRLLFNKFIVSLLKLNPLSYQPIYTQESPVKDLILFQPTQMTLFHMAEILNNLNR